MPKIVPYSPSIRVIDKQQLEWKTKTNYEAALYAVAVDLRPITTVMQGLDDK